MSLYAIGDLHLALGAPQKSMEVFGGRWQNYVRKIEKGFAVLSDGDLCVICGDLSWGMDLEEALPDFRFLNALPGNKLLVKGNHDYWWATAAKMEAFFAAHGLHRLSILHNNCAYYGEAAVCGTRGWFFEEEKGDAHDKKIMLREVGRLEASLKAANGREKLCFLHYPPLYLHHTCAEILELLEKYKVGLCCYGHIHDKGCHAAFRGEWAGTVYKLVSADFLNFVPAKIR
jgi:predicted phosphohydrolase